MMEYKFTKRGPKRGARQRHLSAVSLSLQRKSENKRTIVESG